MNISDKTAPGKVVLALDALNSQPRLEVLLYVHWNDFNHPSIMVLLCWDSGVLWSKAIEVDL